MEKECCSAFSRGENGFNLLLGLGFLSSIRLLKLGVQVLDGSPEQQQLMLLESSYVSHLSLKLSKMAGTD